MYAVMLIMRVLFLNEAYYFMATSLTIGLWYAIVRTQFKDIAGKEIERPLIDYQTHQNKLFPIMAQMFAIWFTTEEISAVIRRI